MTTTAKPQSAQTPKSQAPAKHQKKSADQRRAERLARFAKLAPRRIRATVKQLKGLDNIARGQGYEFTADQANKIMAYVDQAVESLRNSFVVRINGRKGGDLDISL